MLRPDLVPCCHFGTDLFHNGQVLPERVSACLGSRLKAYDGLLHCTVGCVTGLCKLQDKLGLHKLVQSSPRYYVAYGVLWVLRFN